MKKTNQIQLSDFTESVEPIITRLKEKYKNDPLILSDVYDDPASVNPQLNLKEEEKSRQYVDLVQEGGGVHGIALSGFTYVLEKMGFSFMKMAGTSAGAINTALLSSVYNKREAKALGLDEHKYYETRSEKLLEYLSAKPLSDLVDGEKSWRNLLLDLFSGDVNFSAVKKYGKKVFFYFVAFTVMAVLLMISAIALFFIHESSAWVSVLRIATFAFSIILLLSMAFIFFQYKYLRGLWRKSMHLGINPGNNFEEWIETCMKDNGVATVQDLKNKLADEEKKLGYKYRFAHTAEPQKRPDLEMETMQAKPSVIEANIANPDVSIASIKEKLSEKINQPKTFSTLESLSPIPDIDDLYKSFIARTAKVIGKTGLHKEIVLVTADITNGIKVEFPGMHHMYWGQDMSISPAKYVRASMSIPFFYVPVEAKYSAKEIHNVQTAWQNYLNVKKSFDAQKDIAQFVDGGLLSNFPVNVFYNPEMPLPTRPTIGIRLEFEDDTAPNEIKNELSFVGSIVSTMRFFYDRDFINRHNMYKRTVRSVDTGNIHWLNFDMSDQQKLELFYRGALSAAIFLSKINQENDADLLQFKAFASQLKIGNQTFSIAAELKDFKTEDLSIGNINFDWEDYKRKRVLDALSNDPQLLKEKAMMK